MRFDIDRYKQVVGRLDDSGIDYDAFRSQPLPDRSLRTLRYMHDVEHHTAVYLRDMLVTRAHRDPELTTFLMCWAYEELWHGEALGKVLAAHDRDHGVPVIAAARRSFRLPTRLAPIKMAAISAASEHVTAIFMTWGAINEWTTQGAYGQLAARSQHPVLSDLLHRIMKQEGRHIDFYASQAEERLERSTTAQRLTRLALRRKWQPVGSGVVAESEMRHLITHLFGDESGRATLARIDRRIDRLPGLEGLELVSRAGLRYSDAPSVAAA